MRARLRAVLQLVGNSCVVCCAVLFADAVRDNGGNGVVALLMVVFAGNVFLYWLFPDDGEDCE